MSETNYQKILRILLKPLNTFERAAQQMATMRFVNNATGETLTMLGKLVGQRRDGVVDDELYRRYVRTRIAVNASDGIPEEMYTITKLVVTEDGAEFVLDNQGTAAFVMRIVGAETDWEVAEVLIGFLRKAVDGGVRVILEWLTAAPSGSFAFAAVDFSDPADGLGFRSFDETTGGAMASAME